ncbi:hypothetical protein PGB90_001478 [Kerria lacca]
MSFLPLKRDHIRVVSGVEIIRLNDKDLYSDIIIVNLVLRTRQRYRKLISVQIVDNPFMIKKKRKYCPFNEDVMNPPF